MARNYIEEAKMLEWAYFEGEIIPFKDAKVSIGTHSLQYGTGAFAGIRYIEVKARAQSGAIRLSANEWKKARRYGDDFWLYIVTWAGTNEPQLQRIQNPATHLQMDEDIFATGYIIPEQNWQQTVQQ